MTIATSLARVVPALATLSFLLGRVARADDAGAATATAHSGSLASDPQEASPNVGLFRLPAHRGGADALAGPEGFGFLSKDNDFGLMIHWVLQADVQGQLGTLPAGADRSSFLVRFAGVALAARFYERIRSELLVNFAGGSSALSEAWVDVEVTRWLHLKAGLFHYPISLERSTTGIFFPLVSASLPSALLASGDIGAQAWGRIDDGLVEYNLALVNGATAGNASAALDADSGKDVVARLFVQPFLETGWAKLRYLGLGIGASDGVHRGTLTTPELPRLASWGGVTYLAYKNDGTVPGTALATGASARLVPQLTWHAGPVSAYGEYVRGWDEVSGSRVTYEALGGVVAFVPTGEDSVPLHYVIPAHNFAPSRGEGGAVELVVSGGFLDVDAGGASPQLPPGSGSRRVESFAGGVNWYPNLGIRVMVDLQHSTFAPLAATASVPDETVLIGRFQVVL